MNFRGRLIRGLTFMGGLYFFLEFVLPERVAGVKFSAYSDQVSTAVVVVGAMALGLGLINLVAHHGSRLLLRRSGWLNSLALLTGLLAMALVTAHDWYASEKIALQSQAFYVLRDFSLQIEKDFKAQRAGVAPWSERNRRLAEAVQAAAAELAERLAAQSAPDGAESRAAGAVYRKTLLDLASQAREQAAGLLAAKAEPPDFSLNSSLAATLGRIGSEFNAWLMLNYEASAAKRTYSFLFNGLFVSLGSAMFSLLGFYIAAAAYRAFRVRSAESALMMAAALIVMLGQIPFGVWLCESLPDMRLWLLQKPNVAAFRAIAIGAGVASLVMAFRMWFSLESEGFGGGKS